jgi:hypothetical protein
VVTYRQNQTAVWHDKPKLRQKAIESRHYRATIVPIMNEKLNRAISDAPNGIGIDALLKQLDRKSVV